MKHHRQTLSAGAARNQRVVYSHVVYRLQQR